MTVQVSPAQAPALIRVDDAGEGVGDGDEIGAYPRPVEDDVVAGVHHGRHRCRVHDREQATEQAGRAHPSRQGDDQGRGVTSGDDPSSTRLASRSTRRSLRRTLPAGASLLR
jgi:hypothetical protein